MAEIPAGGLEGWTSGGVIAFAGLASPGRAIPLPSPEVFLMSDHLRVCGRTIFTVVGFFVSRAVDESPVCNRRCRVRGGDREVGGVEGSVLEKFCPATVTSDGKGLRESRAGSLMRVSMLPTFFYSQRRLFWV